MVLELYAELFRIDFGIRGLIFAKIKLTKDGNVLLREMVY